MSLSQAPKLRRSTAVLTLEGKIVQLSQRERATAA